MPDDRRKSGEIAITLRHSSASWESIKHPNGGRSALKRHDRPRCSHSVANGDHLCKLNEFQIIGGPVVFGALGLQDPALRFECFYGSGIVRYEDHRAGETPQCVENLRTAGGI